MKRTLITLILAIAVMPGFAAAQSLVVVDNDQDVVDGVLHLGAGGELCCDDKKCGGNFKLDNTGSTRLSNIEFSPIDLTSGADRIPASALRFNPASVKQLGPNGVRTITVKIEVPAGTKAGQYVGLIVIEDDGYERVELAVSTIVCGPPAEPALEILADADGIELESETGACRRDPFRGSVSVRNSGGVTLTDVRLSIRQTIGFRFEIEPSSLALAPGDEARFQIVATPAGLLPGGVFLTTLSARDADVEASDEVALSLRLCQFDSDQDTSTDEPTVVANDPKEDDPAEDDPAEDDPSDDDPSDDDPSDDDPTVVVDDPRRPRLIVEHRLSRSAARVGEILTSTIIVRNIGHGIARNVSIEDRLPAGLLYAEGRSALDGFPYDDPTREGGYRWTVPNIDAGEETTLRFQLVVSPAARRGTARSRVWVRTALDTIGPIDASLEITRHSLQPFGEVRGVVRYLGGGGVPGVRILLDSREEVRTDEQGRFVFDGLLGGEHLVTLDARTLTAGDRLRSEDSQFIHLFSGSVERIDFQIHAQPMLTLSLRRVDVDLKMNGALELARSAEVTN